VYNLRGRTVSFNGLDQKTDKVKVYQRDNIEFICSVSNITADSFDIDRDIDQDTLFVYGSKINDFKTINYQSITITNLQAIQELDNKVKQQDKQIQLLMEHLTTMTNQLNSLTLQVNSINPNPLSS
jgi:hypothetical protein